MTKCNCVSKHVPLPHHLYTYNGVEVCPTTYENAIQYEMKYREHNGRPPGSVRKHFSIFVQNLVDNSLNE